VDHVSLTDAQWSLTITLLVGSVATPVMGRLGDGPHRRGVVLGAIHLVLAGSVLAALPLGFGLLVAGRWPRCRDRGPRRVWGSGLRAAFPSRPRQPHLRQTCPVWAAERLVITSDVVVRHSHDGHRRPIVEPSQVLRGVPAAGAIGMPALRRPGRVRRVPVR
jgi:hypothetical protein